MVSKNDLIFAKDLIFLVVGVMAGIYGGSNGGMIGKSIVYQITFLMEDTLLLEVLSELFQRDFAVAIAAVVGTFVGCATPPAAIFFLSNEVTKILEKSADKFYKIEEGEYNETGTEYTKSKGNKKRSNKSKTNKKSKPNNKRQSYGTQNNETRTETEWRDDELENAYELLGVNYDATMDEIQSRYRRLALIHHPDKGGNYDDWHKLVKAMDIIKNLNI